MSFTVGRGKFQQNSILWPSNHGMAMVAKNRKQQVVGQQNERTKEALKVDGVELQIFLKRNSGQLCSCGMCDSVTNKNFSGLSESGIQSTNPFEDMSIDMDLGVNQNDIQNQPAQSWNPKDDFEENLTEDLIAQYAEGQDNSLIYGGDKTPCGICYGTGYKNGYELYNGKRIVLDFWDRPDYFGFTVQRTYPYSYVASFDSSNFIIWKFHAPTFFKEFLGIRLRNNTIYCKDYTLYISFDGENYQEYVDDLLKARKGMETYVWLKVVPYTMNRSDSFSITHIELFYQLGEFPYGDFAPIEETENFELFEALRTTNLELAGDANYLNRESVICEKKQGKLWKIISLTPHMDSERQIFKNELSLRMVQESENLYLLKLINEPYILLNYRGLEQKQDMLTYNGDVEPNV